MTATAVCADTAAPLFLFAGRGFLSCDLEELRGALIELNRWEHLPPSFNRADWEKALTIPPLAMQRESVRLFYHPNGAPCPPWQSVYTDEAALMGRTHHDAMEWYREAGMEPCLSSEPADHAGLLLSFYGRLLMDETTDEQLEEFRAQHLTWLREFCQTMQAETRLDFYRLLGELTRSLL
ncbi:MAG: molecular chaperone TorD family protein [Acidobacteria bacterium]|nr:molecular chaperone TorD family protein [Acidobacteriota bacterium]